MNDWTWTLDLSLALIDALLFEAKGTQFCPKATKAT